MSIFGKKDAEVGVMEKEELSHDIQLGIDAMKNVKNNILPIEQEDAVLDVSTTTLLTELGFNKVSETIKRVADVKTKENMAALAGYKRLSRATFDLINKELKQRTKVSIDNTGGRRYIELSATDVADYKGVPPKEVLLEMKKAKETGIFKSFRIIHPSLREIPDPILVGEIEGTDDFYSVAEWGEDIHIKDFERFENKEDLNSTYASLMAQMMAHSFYAI